MSSWFLFGIAALIIAVILFIPGFLFCRGLRFSRLVSLAAAPVISIAFIAVLPIIYYKLTIPCTGLTVFVPTLIISLVTYALSHFAKHKRIALLDVDKKSSIVLFGHTCSVEHLSICVYLIIGTLVCWYMYLSELTTPDAFYSRWDNQTHINDLRAFLDTGIWSSLHTNKYAGAAAYSVGSVSNADSFYPAAWHDIVATTSSLSGIHFLIVSNALNAFLISIVFPLSMFLLMKVIFPQQRRVIAAGALMTPSFLAFPWAYFLYGPYVANLIGQCAFPAVMAIFILFLEKKLVRTKLPSFITFGLLAFIGLTFSHPNTIFSALLFLGAYGCSFVNRAVKQSAYISVEKKQALQALAVFSFLTVICFIWAICYNLPALHNVIFFHRTVNSSIPHALITIGTLSLSIASRPAFILAPIAFIGLVVCIRKKIWWILIPCFIMAVAYYETRTSESVLKNILGGFWYVDIRRLSANLSMFLIPVASIGFSSCTSFIERLVQHKKKSSAAQKYAFQPMHYAVFLTAGLVFIILNFVSVYPIPFKGALLQTGIGTIKEQLHNIYTPEIEQVYNRDEVEFVDKVIAIIPENALVLNMPHDGSMFAYGVNGLNTYYRSASTQTSEDGTLIRNNLVNYADSDTVANAVAHTGAKYLLQLDQGATLEDGAWLVQYTVARYNTGPEHWNGINAMRDDTPGFKLILSEGDMRLFEIEDVNTAA